VARLAADVGLRINEACMLDLNDVLWELGRFGKLNVRYGKGSRRKGPKPRLVPLINGADRSLCWFIENVLGLFGIEPSGHGTPLFSSERKNTDRRHYGWAAARVATGYFRTRKDTHHGRSIRRTSRNRQTRS
jgi:integrase